MFEQTSKNIYDILHKEAGRASELDCLMSDTPMELETRHNQRVRNGRLQVTINKRSKSLA